MAESVHVTSGGVSPAAADLGACPPEVIAVTAPLGLDLTTHRSRRLDDSVVAAADLVVTMTRSHLRTVATTHPDSFTRTFTLRELVRRLEDGEAVADLGRERTTSSLLGEDPADDIDDPFGRPMVAYERMVAQLDPLVTTFGAHIARHLGGQP